MEEAKAPCNCIYTLAADVKSMERLDAVRLSDRTKNTTTTETLPANIQIKEKQFMETLDPKALRNNKKDHYGNVIAKGQKVHKISFRDTLGGQQIADIVEVESYKEFNVMSDVEGPKCSCAVL